MFVLCAGWIDRLNQREQLSTLGTLSPVYFVQTLKKYVNLITIKLQ